MSCIFSAKYRVALGALLAIFASGPAVAAPSLVVNASELNLRTAINGKVLCALPRNALLEQASPPKNGWVKVQSTSGACRGTGYVSERFVKALNEAAAKAKVSAKAPVKEIGAAKVPLVITENYNPNKEPGRGFTEFTSSLGLFAFGNLYRATALDIEKMLLEKLSLPELKTYFPSEKERRNLAASMAETINRTHLRGAVMTNDKVIAATQYAAEELLTLVIQRAMAKEGVNDPSRRAIWKNKILAPFRGCMNKARTYQEGNKCLDAAQEDAVKNIGLAITYEMVRQEIGPGYTNNVGRDYPRCLNLKKAGANNRVQNCVLSIVRAAAANLGTDKVREAASGDAPGSADAIAKAVRPAFEKCLAKASERKGFGKCADDLVITAGGEIAASALLNNEHVRAYYPASKERRDLAANGKKQFLSCMEGNRAANKRDDTGNLATANCANQVRLETAREVAHALIESNLEKMDDILPPQRKSIKDSVGKKLNACWDSRSTEAKNNACMKDSIEELVTAIAGLKLGNSIPPVLSVKEPRLKEELVQFVRECIRRELPDDVMNSTDAANRVDSCAGQLLKRAALKVADFELRQVLHGKTSDESAADALVKKLVDTNLATCLGSTPNDALLSKCTAELKTSAAAAAGELLFKEEFDRFVAKNGGAENLGITLQERTRFLDQTLKSHNACLKENVKDSAEVDHAVDACFKASIHTLASYLGKLAFQKSSREYVSDRNSLSRLSERFKNDLSACLQEKNGREHSLNDYVANIDVCANRLTSSYTVELGAQQVADAVNTNLSGEEFSSQRALIRDSLLTAFSGCIEKSEEKKQRDGCVASLKRDATKEITIAAARAQATSLLNGAEPPKEFAEAEEKLQACLDSGKEPDLCAREHAQSVAKILGALKLKVTLASALGADTYKASGRTIASLQTDFFACVDKIPGNKPDAKFMDALKECGETMENKGTTYVQQNLNEWMQAPGSSEFEISLRRDAANAIPCLGPVLPSGPVSEEALQKLNPEGLLQAVAEVVGDYINYDAKKADQHFDQLLKQVMTDLEAAGPLTARQNLFDLLIKGGMVDQLLKSMVRSQVRKALSGLPAEDQLSPELQAILMSPNTLDQALTPEVMAQLRPFMADQLLKPLLIQGKTLSDPKLKAAMKELERQVALKLLDSPSFGERLVTGAVQRQIDHETSGITGWFGSWMYSYDWNQIRNTEAGRRAETYVRENVIRPLMLGENLSPEENLRRRAEASRLVTTAVKSQ